jgi:hypothetical protein
MEWLSVLRFICVIWFIIGSISSIITTDRGGFSITFPGWPVIIFILTYVLR